MKNFKVIRDCDESDFFTIESENRETALWDALYQIGWRLVEVTEDETNNTQRQK